MGTPRAASLASILVTLSLASTSHAEPSPLIRIDFAAPPAELVLHNDVKVTNQGGGAVPRIHDLNPIRRDFLR